jgi:hypothetical protein
MENWILSRNLYKSVYHLCDSRNERISFLWTPTTNETHPFLKITLRASRTEIVVSHLSILGRLAHLTNRRNQNAVPVERINSMTAFAPLNNGSTVVIMSRKKAADSIAKS